MPTQLLKIQLSKSNKITTFAPPSITPSPSDTPTTSKSRMMKSGDVFRRVDALLVPCHVDFGGRSRYGAVWGQEWGFGFDAGASSKLF